MPIHYKTKIYPFSKRNNPNSIKVSSIVEAKEEISVRKSRYPNMINSVSITSDGNLEIRSASLADYMSDIYKKIKYK